MLDVTRKENKYDIGLIETADMKRRLGIYMESDPHNGETGYLVRSLYFDTLYDADFEQKVDGYDERQKIRLRVYSADAMTAKLEVKEKEDALQRKRSLSIERGEAQQMINGDYRFLLRREEPLAHWLYAFLNARCYRPKCVVEYDRYAYILEHNDTRITFDQNLRASESNYDIFDKDLVLYPVSAPGAVTMEVKYTGFLLSHLKNELNYCDKTRCSNSKYCRARMITKRGRI
ncbi:MAG: polyphosphate polymerase domain-containing protein [Lachnospiraceae bacterium]|nr:polyphosphate polymerase domain-containing protein [Lachnospiraceae bacterium]